MKEYINKTKDDILQRKKDRRELMWRMEDEGQEKVQTTSGLEIGDPNDKYEQEADAVANKVVNGGVKHSSSSFTESDTSLMAKSENGTLQGTEQLQTKLDSSKGSGQSLDPAIQNEMESKMGADLSGVKIHNNSNAHEMSKGINAKAFTYGQDIYFNKGNYNTTSNEGKGLLAHELAHTQQQKNGLSRKIQRAMKFEIQTDNYVWQVDKSGSPKHVPRKLGNEDGSVPGYLVTGKRGVPKKNAGDNEFHEVVGERAMIEARTKPVMKENIFIDQSLEAQYVVLVLVDNLDYHKNSGKAPPETDIHPLKPIDRAAVMTPQYNMAPGAYNPNTYEYRYFDSRMYEHKMMNLDPNLFKDYTNSEWTLEKGFDVKPYEVESNKKKLKTLSLDDTTFEQIHRDETGVFRAGHIKLMSEDAPKYDETKYAQFEKTFQFNVPVTQAGLIGTTVVEGQLQLVDQKDNSKDPSRTGLFNPNTFEFIYLDDKGVQLQIHLNPSRVFEDRHVKLMTVGNDVKPGSEPYKKAQYIETWKVTVDPATGTIPYLDTFVTLQATNTVDNGTDAATVSPGTYEKKYYISTDFESDGINLKKDAHLLNVHLSTDGGLIPGHLKFVEEKPIKLKKNKKPSEQGKEQTAMELQPEEHGFIEFETPKWFTTWEELKWRVQDAVDMTVLLSQPGNAVSNPELSNLQAKMKPIKGADVGDLYKWPLELISPELSAKVGGNTLYVEIVSPEWNASIQTSEGIPLSEAGSILTDQNVYGFSAKLQKPISVFVPGHAKTLFDNAKKSSWLASKNDSLFTNLISFLELVLAYIMYGQINEQGGHKDTFRFMARTDFASMYSNLLSPDEQQIFDLIVNDQKNPILNPVLEAEINQIRILRSAKRIFLNRFTRFYAGGHNAGVSKNPLIRNWLINIPLGEDLLAGDQANVADAIGGRKVNMDTGDKDYKQALFEKRSSPGTPASQWLDYAEQMFNMALTRSSDTPDDPTTPQKTRVAQKGKNKGEVKIKEQNEASKTSIKRS